jgi:hypothetical protein
VRDNQRVGAIRVNVVCADLQRRNYEVFREDGLCSFDIVAHKAGELLRIEVKGDGTKIPRKGPIGTAKGKIDCRKFDVLAAVRELEEGFGVRYIHSIAHTHTMASYELTGADAYSNHTTKKNISRAENFKGGTE